MAKTGILFALAVALVSLANVYSYKLSHFRVGVSASRALTRPLIAVPNSNHGTHLTVLRNSEPVLDHIHAQSIEVPSRRNGLVGAYGSIKQNLQSFFNRLARWFYQLMTSLRPGKRSIQHEVKTNSSASTFVSLPSVPINKMPSLSIGKQYAQARLAEIESYLSRGSRGGAGKGKRKYTSTDMPELFKRSIVDLSDEELSGKRVFVRCDLDAPIQEGKIIDDTRLRSSVPTIQHLASKGAKVILCGHLGTPSGKGYDATFSLAPVATLLSAMLQQNVALVPDCIGISVQRAVSEMASGDVILLENVRFYAEEEANDAQFALQMSRNADVYVNNAFTSSRAATASTAGIAAHISPAVSGLSLQDELTYSNKLMHSPARPFVALLGGSSMQSDNHEQPVDHTNNPAESEMVVLESLVEVADVLVLAGNMAAPFLKARGYDIGVMKVDDSCLELARRIQARAATRGVTVHLLHEPATGTEKKDPSDGMCSMNDLRALLTTAKTVFWRGEMNAHGSTDSAATTASIVETLAALTDAGGVTVLCGEEAAAAVQHAGVAGRMSYISSDARSFEDLLIGRPLAGVVALNDKV